MRRRKIPITQLIVNSENPRFDAVKNENEAIDLMMKEAGQAVFNLARDIAWHGPNPAKVVMVVSHGNKYLALDGNRRLVAVKLLNKPNLTRNKEFRDKFAELRNQAWVVAPAELECLVFSDAESASAYRWVKLEHTGANKGVGTLKWDSAQSQRFKAQQEGRTLPKSLQLIDYANENKINTDQVDSTTLDRMLSSPAVRDLVGVGFSDGNVTIDGSRTQVTGNLRKLFAAMSQPTFTVRDVYTPAKAKSWVASVLGVTKETKERPKTKATTKPSRKTDPLDGDWITRQLHTAYPYQNRVKAMLGELKGLKLYCSPLVTRRC